MRTNKRKVSSSALEQLDAHRAPLRALFVWLECAWRSHGKSNNNETGPAQPKHWFSLVEEESGASPLGWTVAKHRTIPNEWLTARVTSRWKWWKSPKIAQVDFETFQRVLASSTGDLDGALRTLAEMCCAFLRQSCVSSLELKAPWWLLDRGETSTAGAAGPTDQELAAITHCAFHVLGSSGANWSLEDCYALCRDAGLFGETLTPASLLAAFEKSRPTDLQSFEDLLARLASLWWGGEKEDETETVVVLDPLERLIVERVLPLLASRRRQRQQSAKRTLRRRLAIDEASLGIVREHDMALRCLFVAYCSSSAPEKSGEDDDPRIAPLSTLHFARDFRLLAADLFSPTSVIDAARASHHPNHPGSVKRAEGLRWPEFVETLIRLSTALVGDEEGATLEESISSLLSLMDPDGRVFFVGDRVGAGHDFDDVSFVEEDQDDDLDDEADADLREEEKQQNVVTTTYITTTNPPSTQGKLSTTRKAAKSSLQAAVEATRRLASTDPDSGVDAIVDAVEAAARLADDDEGAVNAALRQQSQQSVVVVKEETSCFASPEPAQPATAVGVQVDLSHSAVDEWPPPPRSSPDDIWAAPAAKISPFPSKDAFAEMASEPRERKPLRKGEIRRQAATQIQKLCRGFSLRRRLAMLHDRILQMARAAAAPSPAPAPAPATAVRNKTVPSRLPKKTAAFKTPQRVEKQPATQRQQKSKSIASPQQVVSTQPAATTHDDERAVIHAFALAALLGDGSPRRVARARALVETLKDLPEALGNGVSKGTTGTTRSGFVGQTLDELEESLRDALARVALEEKWNLEPDDSSPDSAKNTAARLSAMIEAHPGYSARKAARDAAWEIDEAPANEAAMQALRELIPADVASSDKPSIAADLAAKIGASDVDADDPRLAPLVDRVWTERALWLVHLPRDQIAKTHIADLRSRYTFANLDLVELRAVYRALPVEFEFDEDEAKAKWRAGLRRKLVEITTSSDHYDSTGAEGIELLLHGHSAYDVLDEAKRPARIVEKQWRECWDDNYNRHYYFNDVTGESQWNEPEDYLPLDDDEASNAPSELTVPPLEPPADMATPITPRFFPEHLDTVKEEAGSAVSSPVLDRNVTNELRRRRHEQDYVRRSGDENAHDNFDGANGAMSTEDKGTETLTAFLSARITTSSSGYV